MQTWTAEELRAFLASAEEHPLFALFRLAASTGMRRGECLGIRWKDVKLDASRLSVRQQLSRQGDKIGFGPVKTKAGRRSISLDPVTVAAIRGHRQTQAAERLAFGPGYRDLDLLFAHPDGSPQNPDVISQTFERLIKRAGLRPIRFHDLRHTHATLALHASIHPKVVQERLGHSSITVTLDLYSHAIPALQEDAASRIADVVDRALNPEAAWPANL
jgi:integrase